VRGSLAKSNECASTRSYVDPRRLFENAEEAGGELKANEQRRPQPATTTNTFSVPVTTIVVDQLPTSFFLYPKTTNTSTTMSSFMSQVMQPGGGVMLLPFVRGVIGLLLVLTLAGFASGVARIHMAILAFLSAGLLVSLSMFESEFKRLNSYSSDEPAQKYEPSQAGGKSTAAKSD
jgi:hypothetical protein